MVSVAGERASKGACVRVSARVVADGTHSAAGTPVPAPCLQGLQSPKTDSEAAVQAGAARRDDGSLQVSRRQRRTAAAAQPILQFLQGAVAPTHSLGPSDVSSAPRPSPVHNAHQQLWGRACARVLTSLCVLGVADDVPAGRCWTTLTALSHAMPVRRRSTACWTLSAPAQTWTCCRCEPS